jgi:hypothetical protein
MPYDLAPRQTDLIATDGERISYREFYESADALARQGQSESRTPDGGELAKPWTRAWNCCCSTM